MDQTGGGPLQPGERLRSWLADAGGKAVLVLLCYTAVLQFRAPSSLVSWLWPAALVAAWSAWHSAGDPALARSRRLMWRVLALALAAFAAGGMATALLGLAGLPQLAGNAALLRLAAPPLLALAGIWFIRSEAHERAQPSVYFDAAVAVLTVGALLWFVFGRHAVAGLSGRPLPDLLELAGASLDTTLLLMLVAVLATRARGSRCSTGTWLAAAVALLVVADFTRLDLPAMHWLADPALAARCQLVALTLFAVAAHTDRLAGGQPGLEVTGDPLPSGGGLLPIGGLALLAVVSLGQYAGRWSEPEAVLTMAAFLAGALLLLRQHAATRALAAHEAAQARSEAEARFTSLVRNSADAIAIITDGGRFLYLTPSVERVFGLRAEAMLGRRLVDFVAVEDKARVREFHVSTLGKPGASARLELNVPRGAGHFRMVEIIGTNLSGEPTVGGQVLNIHDVTERRRLEDQLKRLAFHDPLTLLANRALFRDRAEHALARTSRRGGKVAAIFVDLDNFKKINDSLGHGEGDRVLRATAQRLSKCTRSEDTVARLGGDEFAVLIEDCPSEEQVVATAGRIVEALREPFAFGGSSLRVAASVGVAFVGSGDGVEELLRNADVAMYDAKAKGKGRYAVFQPQMQEAVRDRLRIEADLTRAIGKNELRLLFQPIVDLETGYLLGVEALVRWQHPQRGLIPPAEFIGVAEETGQVVGLGRWVLYEACSQVREWQKRMPMGQLLRVAVNVSGQQLQGDDLQAEVTGALEHSGLDPGCLVIEMTESVVMSDTEATFAKLQRLKRLGVRIAIDDFGTGYSSLSYLHRFPIDILKIDRSFVERLGREKDGAELARAIITLGETLGLEVVAEGIELEHQVRELLELGCVAGQGFYYSRPALLKEIEFSHHARLRQDRVKDLPPEAEVSATGRFVRPVFDDVLLQFDATGSGDR